MKLWKIVDEKDSWRQFISFSYFCSLFLPLSLSSSNHLDLILTSICRVYQRGKTKLIYTHTHTLIAQWENRKTTANDSIIIRHMEQREEQSRAQVLMSIVIRLVIQLQFISDLFDSVIFAVDFPLSFHNCIVFGSFISWKCDGTECVAQEFNISIVIGNSTWHDCFFLWVFCVKDILCFFLKYDNPNISGLSVSGWMMKVSFIPTKSQCFDCLETVIAQYSKFYSRCFSIKCASLAFSPSNSNKYDWNTLTQVKHQINLSQSILFIST